MTDFPDLKLKALVSFPAAVFGGTGLAVRQESGNFYFDLAYGELAQIAAVPTPAEPTTFLALWEQIQNTYQRISITDLKTEFGGGGGGTPSDTNPIMDGVAAPGVLTTFSRGDHVHPTDTSRASASAPTVQRFLTPGSGTYTRPANCRWIEVMAQAAGGGAAGSGVNGGAATNGTVGGDTTFGSSLIIAKGGNPPAAAGLSTGGQGGSGGVVNAPAIALEITAGGGGVAANLNPNGASSYPMPGAGGSSRFGGGGVGGGPNSSGGPGQPNTGGGGGGTGAGNVANTVSGAAAGAGESVRAIIPSPAATYPYTVGNGGLGGSAGASGQAGAAGGAGGLWITEYY